MSEASGKLKINSEKLASRPPNISNVNKNWIVGLYTIEDTCTLESLFLPEERISCPMLVSYKKYDCTKRTNHCLMVFDVTTWMGSNVKVTTSNQQEQSKSSVFVQIIRVCEKFEAQLHRIRKKYWQQSTMRELELSKPVKTTFFELKNHSQRNKKFLTCFFCQRFFSINFSTKQSAAIYVTKCDSKFSNANTLWPITHW